MRKKGEEWSEEGEERRREGEEWRTEGDIYDTKGTGYGDIDDERNGNDYNKDINT